MTEADEKLAKAAGAIKSARVLVVEDEEFFRQLLVRLLGRLGIKDVVIATAGAEALKVLGQESAQGFDLAIIDIMMPEMTGFDLARMIREGAVPRYKDIPILILTGQSTDENVRKGRVHRIQGFIVKPPTVELLERHIARALGKDSP